MKIEYVVQHSIFGGVKMDMRERIQEIILLNKEIFENAFLNIKTTDDEILQTEQILGFKIPDSYIWFLKEFGHGGFLFEFMGYGLNGKSIFAEETLKQRENGLPLNLLIFQNCDEYYECINVDNGGVVSWSMYDKMGVVDTNHNFYEYFIECLENTIDNYE